MWSVSGMLSGWQNKLNGFCSFKRHSCYLCCPHRDWISGCKLDRTKYVPGQRKGCRSLCVFFLWTGVAYSFTKQEEAVIDVSFKCPNPRKSKREVTEPDSYSTGVLLLLHLIPTRARHSKADEPSLLHPVTTLLQWLELAWLQTMYMTEQQVPPGFGQVSMRLLTGFKSWKLTLHLKVTSLIMTVWFGQHC